MWPLSRGQCLSRIHNSCRSSFFRERLSDSTGKATGSAGREGRKGGWQPAASTHNVCTVSFWAAPDDLHRPDLGASTTNWRHTAGTLSNLTVHPVRLAESHDHQSVRVNRPNKTIASPTTSPPAHASSTSAEQGHGSCACLCRGGVAGGQHHRRDASAVGGGTVYPTLPAPLPQAAENRNKFCSAAAVSSRRVGGDTPRPAHQQLDNGPAASPTTKTSRGETPNRPKQLPHSQHGFRTPILYCWGLETRAQV